MLSTDLMELGLSKKEADVYLAILELGGSYVSLIAKKAGINRVACYHTLGSLVRMGVVSSYTQNNLKYFSVESPQILVAKQKERYKKAENILPELLSITNALAYKPKIQYYEGIEGAKNIFEDTLNATDEIVGYTNLAKLPDVLTEEYLKDYAVLKTEKKIKTRMISPKFDEAIKYLGKIYPEEFDRNLIEILFVNPKQFMFEYEINIYGNKVSLVSLNPDELFGMIIESPTYANTQKAIFNLAWLGATSFIAK